MVQPTSGRMWFGDPVASTPGMGLLGGGLIPGPVMPGAGSIPAGNSFPLAGGIGAPMGGGPTPSVNAPPPSANATQAGMSAGQVGPLALTALNQPGFDNPLFDAAATMLIPGYTFYKQAVGQSQARRVMENQQNVISKIDTDNPQSYYDAAQTFAKGGDIEAASSLIDQGQKIERFSSLTPEQRFQVVKPIFSRTQEVKSAYESIMTTVNRSGGVDNLKNLDEVSAGGIVQQLQQTEMRGVLSDEEFARVQRAGSPMASMNTLKNILGLPASAPSSEVLVRIVQRAEDNANTWDRLAREAKNRTGFDVDVGGEVTPSGLGTRRYGRMTKEEKPGEGSKWIPSPMGEYSIRPGNQTIPKMRSPVL